MRSDLTDVTVVLDRSGSMGSCRVEAENGLKHFIAEQAKQPGECLFTLVQFDSEYEFICRGVPIKQAPDFVLVPRGMTALNDAVGRAINETGQRLAAMPEDQRPGLVVFVILTDGLENASHEFNRARVRQMIEHQRTAYSWQFTFLGANMDAEGEAASLGIDASSSASYSVAASQSAFGAASSNVSRMRAVRTRGGSVRCAYTPEERKSMS